MKTLKVSISRRHKILLILSAGSGILWFINSWLSYLTEKYITMKLSLVGTILWAISFYFLTRYVKKTTVLTSGLIEMTNPAELADLEKRVEKRKNNGGV